MAELITGPHLTEEQLTWHFYGEDEIPVAEVEAHLAACRLCRSEFEALKAALASLDTFGVPARQPGYEDRLWRELGRREPPLAVIRRHRRPSWWTQLAWGAGVAALVIAAFLAGRGTVSRPDPRTTTPQPPAAVRERLLVDALGDHFDQSARVLLEIGNESLGVNERERAEGLLAANRLYRQTAALDGQASLAATLEDLERMLLDIAHAPEQPTMAELRELQTRMEEQGLLFKVQALGMRLRQINRQPLAPAASFSKPRKG